jgi:hypothetical protein
MVEITRNEGNLVGVKISGKLTDADYKQFVPVLESAAEKGPLHLLVDMTGFQGWERGALWDDMKLDRELGSKMEYLAFVGDKTWQEWMAKICKPFTRAQIQYFHPDQSEQAWKWVQQDLTDYEDD